MTRGVYKRTKEHGKKIGKVIKEQHKTRSNYGMRGKHHSENSKRKISDFWITHKDKNEKRKRNIRENAKINPNFGMRNKKLSEETKRRISEGNTGRIVSEETRKKIKLGNKGKIRSEEVRKKISKSQTGKKLSEETKKKIGESSKRWHGEIGFSEEARKKIGLGHKGKIMSKEAIKKIKKARAKQILPKKDTSIEVKIQNFLKQLRIEYFTHRYINIKHGYQCDILIPSMNLVIECDGNYWHKYPIGRDIDHIRTKELLEKGFKVLRLWEIDIKKMELNEFREKLNN